MKWFQEQRTRDQIWQKMFLLLLSLRKVQGFWELWVRIWGARPNMYEKYILVIWMTKWIFLINYIILFVHLPFDYWFCFYYWIYILRAIPLLSVWFANTSPQFITFSFVLLKWSFIGQTYLMLMKSNLLIILLWIVFLLWSLRIPCLAIDPEYSISVYL